MRRRSDKRNDFAKKETVMKHAQLDCCTTTLRWLCIWGGTKMRKWKTNKNMRKTWSHCLAHVLSWCEQRFDRSVNDTKINQRKITSVCLYLFSCGAHWPGLVYLCARRVLAADCSLYTSLIWSKFIIYCFDLLLIFATRLLVIDGHSTSYMRNLSIEFSGLKCEFQILSPTEWWIMNMQPNIESFIVDIGFDMDFIIIRFDG